jgi:hypothetical protein
MPAAIETAVAKAPKNNISTADEGPPAEIKRRAMVINAGNKVKIVGTRNIADFIRTLFLLIERRLGLDLFVTGVYFI